MAPEGVQPGRHATLLTRGAVPAAGGGPAWPPRVESPVGPCATSRWSSLWRGMGRRRRPGGRQAGQGTPQTHGRHGEPYPSRVRPQRCLGARTGRWCGPRGAGPVPTAGVVAACAAGIRLRSPGPDAGLLRALAWLEALRAARQRAWPRPAPGGAVPAPTHGADHARSDRETSDGCPC